MGIALSTTEIAFHAGKKKVDPFDMKEFKDQLDTFEKCNGKFSEDTRDMVEVFFESVDEMASEGDWHSVANSAYMVLGQLLVDGCE